jgi:DNA-directed RNA polymerase specialized sigma24 family protein
VLPDTHRAAFLLNSADGACVEDRARRLGLQFEPATSRLRYALQKLRCCMGQYLDVLEQPIGRPAAAGTNAAARGAEVSE